MVDSDCKSSEQVEIDRGGLYNVGTTSSLQTALESHDVQQVACVLQNVNGPEDDHPAWIEDLLSRRPLDLDRLPSNHNGPLAREGYHVRDCIHQISHEIPRRQSPDSANAILPQQELAGNDVKLKIQGMCGLGGVVPVSKNLDEWDGTIDVASHSSSVSYIRDHEWAMAKTDRVGFISKVFARTRNSLEGTLKAIGCIQQQGLCCDSFTVLVRNSKDRSKTPRAELIRTEIKPALDLFHVLTRLSREYNSTEELDKLFEHEQEPLLHSIAKILKPFPGFYDFISDGGEATMSSVLHVCTLAVQFLSLAFVSYVQGHCGNLRPFFINRGLECVALSGLGISGAPFIMCSLVKLSCLGSMLEEPVLAFVLDSATWAEYDGNLLRTIGGDNVETKRFDVATMPVDLIDTWGPARILSESATQLSPMAAAIFIRGGFISVADLGSDKRLLHWSHGAALDKNLINFNLQQVTVVGAPLVVSRNCAIHADSNLQIVNPVHEVLGPFEEYWKLSSRAVGVTTGFSLKGGFNVQANQGWTKEKECKTYQFHWLLENPWAVQISFCTGAAQRIKLRDLVADLLPIYVKGQWNPSTEWDVLRDEHGISRRYVLRTFKNGDGV
ncbi:uncharacterized protein PAC_19779 [Phialocephala subalpina]|uniref:Uncharacterized protein n=1 Tax=Phialocephala subalpina TaxID=576137 RepID=A0A1L7XY02_9HELO|nr:uncharacterized protein PAC_19779 [Phialocephala subalpina]